MKENKNEIKITKNQEFIVDIIDNGYEGEGIAKIDNFTIFIPNAIKGEKIKIAIVKVNKNFGFARIVDIIEKSKYRKISDCQTYKMCGGCSLRHVEYKYSLDIKTNVVQNLVSKTLDNKIDVLNTIGMEEPLYYRNKLQYPVGIDKEGNAITGVYAKRSHNIVQTNNCLLQNIKAQKVAERLIELINENKISVYNEKTRKGQIRHIIVKSGIKTNQMMLVIVTNKKELKNEDIITNRISNEFSEIKTIIKNINNKDTNVILGNQNITIYGDGYIEDELCGYTFKISPMSFYQINPIQTEVLYNKAIEYAKLDKDDILCDLYCGIGTISICASSFVKKVYGVEIVEEAVISAKENAKLNNVDNIEFLVGDVEKVFDDLINKEKIKPTAIIIDPPRRGLDNITIENILKIKPKKLVYVSCNPATLVRDLKKLEEEYTVQNIQPVDMFPYTSHVESVCVLERK